MEASFVRIDAQNVAKILTAGLEQDSTYLENEFPRFDFLDLIRTVGTG